MKKILLENALIHDTLCILLVLGLSYVIYSSKLPYHRLFIVPVVFLIPSGIMALTLNIIYLPIAVVRGISKVYKRKRCVQ